MQDSSSSKRRKAPALHDAPSEAQLAAGPAAAPNQQQQCQPHPTAVFQMPAGLPREPSPGAMHGCRIAAWSVPAPSADGHSTVGAALASGAHVYWSQLRVPAALRELRPEQQGKEGVVLPLRLQAPAVQQLQQLPARAGEVQALALLPCGGDAQQPGQVLLATVDAFGSGSICRVSPCWEYAGGSSTAAAAADGDGAADGDAAAAAAAVAAPLSPPTVEVQAPLQPMGPCREGGWAGVCFSGGSGSTSTSSPLLLATARSFAKDVTLHDASTGQGLRCFNCLLHPYALSFLPSTVCAAGGGGSSSGGAHVLAVAEGHMVSIWDARVGGAGGGCVQRLVAGTQSQPLYTLAWCHAEGGLLGCAGAERSLFLVEPRKWRVHSKWTGAARQAIHSLAFLDSDPRCAVLAGLDPEVVCGRWDRPGSSAAARPFTSAGPPIAASAVATAANGAAGGDTAAAAAAEAGAAAAGAHRQAAPGAHGSGDGAKRSGHSKAASGADEHGAAGAAPADAAEDLAAAKPASLFSFRGDGRWLGVSKAASSDVLAAYVASGSLVYAQVC